MGTPEFAVPSLEVLLRNQYPVKAVITAPDKQSGRGMKVNESPVKRFAAKAGLTILQPQNLKDPEFIEELRTIRPEVQVVVAFRMLPEVVWDLPAKGTFNLHASLLPQYRGAAPINHALINGETITGLTTFFLRHEIDTGNIIFQEEVMIHPDDNAGSLHDKLMLTGAGLVLKTMQAIEAGPVPTISQSALIRPEQPLKTAPKIFRDDCRINFNQPATVVRNFIRGLSPYPGAFFEAGDGDSEPVTYKVFDCETSSVDIGAPGKILVEDKKRLWISCRKSSLYITEIQMSGKKRMSTADFFLGHSFSGTWRIVNLT